MITQSLPGSGADGHNDGVKTRDVHLVMSGSGTKLYAFLGAIQALHQHGYVFREVTGTSGGAIVAAVLASRYDPDMSYEKRTKAILDVVALSKIIDIGKLRDRRWLAPLPWSRKARFKGKKILKKLREILPEKFDELNIPCTCVALQMNLVRKRTVYLRDGDLPLAVRASMSIPFAFDPVEMDDMLLVDGGWGANFELPAGGKNVVGLLFEEMGEGNKLDINNNVELGLGLLDAGIDSAMQKAIANAPEAEIFHIKTDLQGFDFNMNQTKIQAGMIDGAESIERRLEGNGVLR